MKKSVFKIVLLLGIILCSNTSYSQLIVNKVAKDSIVWQVKGKYSTLPKLVHFFEESDSYVLYYKNAKYQTISDVDYLSIGDLTTTQQFFDLLKDVLENQQEYDIELDGKLWLLKKSGNSVMVFSSYSYFYLNTKQVEQIREKIKNK
jgi:hypothetical protein